MTTNRVNGLESVSADDGDEVKSCCAAAYQSDWARLLLGESFHPGGMALTERLGRALDLKPGMRVLDVAAGQGTSAIHLAKTFGCDVLGVDLGAESVRKANAAAMQAGVGDLARFITGDAERLPVDDAAFDAVVCECAFCTFPDKPTAAREFYRTLTPGGQVGISDLTRTGETPDDLRSLLAWIACIADARPIAEYERYLVEAGLRVTLAEPHDEALADLIRDIQAKLLGAELLVKLKKAKAPSANFGEAKALARAAATAVRARRFGYAVLTATKPALA